MLTVDSYQEACRLDRAALVRLLAEGRPEQRAWAIWALALRSDDPAAFARERQAEPDAGVRRTLAVVLAGHGVTDLVIELARHDPDAAVRGSAIQLVTRLALGGRVPVAVVVEAATREPALLPAILGAVAGDAPAPLVALAETGLAANDPEIALEAFEALLRIGTADTLATARRWMHAQRDALPACDRWLHVRGPISVAEAFADRRVHVRGVVLSRLVAPPWRAVELLVGIDARLLYTALARDDIAFPAVVLARAILAGSHRGFVERLTAQLAAAGHGRALVADIRAAIASRATSFEVSFPDLAGRARRYAQALEIADAGDVLDDLAAHHPVEQLLGLEHAVARWLARVDAPDDLVPLVPELRAYCDRRLGETSRRGTRRRIPDLPALPAAAGTGERNWDEERHFRALAAALARVA